MTKSGRRQDRGSIDKEQRVISVDRRKSIDDIVGSVGFSHEHVYYILTKDLGMKNYVQDYSPDLAPMDFCVFPRLKADLRGSRF